MIQIDAEKMTKIRKYGIRIAALILVFAGAAVAFMMAGRGGIAYPSGSASGQPSGEEQMRAVLDIDTFYSGITIGGVDVSGKTREEAEAELEKNPAIISPEIGIVLSVHGEDYPLDGSLLGIKPDLKTAIEDAFSYGRAETGDSGLTLAERYAAVQNLLSSPKNFSLTYTAARADVSEAVHQLLDPLETAPINATASAFDVEKLEFTITESSEGLSMDFDGAVSDVIEAIESGNYDKEIAVSTEVTQPEITADMLKGTLGRISSTTTKTTDSANRNTNIRIVCEMVDGLVLQPGETFDFNQFIGKRTAAKGFKEAPGIFNGTTRMELGGGICQTSGTLFNSVLKADLQVDERHPHSWPSDYVPVGQDATVTWGGANFRFTNNTEMPIAIHCWYKDRTLTFEIYGRPVDDGMTIELKNVILSSSAPGAPTYVADPAMAAGKTSTVRKAHNAISAQCWKVYYKDGKEVKRELADTSSYRAITAQIAVGTLAADGSICPFDPATGKVTIPSATPVPQPTTVPPVPTPTETPATPTPTPTSAPTVPAEPTGTPPETSDPAA